MKTPLCIKICGLSTPASLDWAIEAGADMVGFVSFPPSPRHVEIGRLAELANLARGRVDIVILTVDASDELLEKLVTAARPDWLQFHGKESPEQVASVRSRLGIPVMKAIGVSSAEDLETAERYAGIVDRLLLDAKPPRDATRPGGLGETFDWTLLQDHPLQTPFLLSGGLNLTNLSEAIRMVRPFGVDVSSGVESAKGVKDETLVRRFVEIARLADMD